MMVLACRTWYSVKQACDKILRSKRPASTNLLSARIVGFDAAMLHSPSKFHLRTPALLPQAVLSEQAVTTQPRLPFLSGSQITWVTAPAVLVQSLPPSQQLCSHRIQVHVIAYRAQITTRRSIDQQRLVTPGKKMPAQFVSAIKTHGVCAQQPFHSLDQICPRCLDHQMKMIAH